MADRKLTVTLVGDSRQLERTLGRTEGRLKTFGRRTGLDQGARGVLSTTGGKGGFLFGSTAFIGGAVGAAALKTTITAASDLNEQVSKTKVVFGESGDAVVEWSQKLATSFGLAETEALTAASTFGSMFKQTGQNEKDAARLARSVTQLGADLASFNNTTVSDALDALRSGLSGEIEPLRRYQVFLTEASVAQRAMADTGKKSTKELTQGEKIMARYELIIKATKQAQGDFSRTSGGLANQERILAAQTQNLAAMFGKVLMPVVIAAVGDLNTLATTLDITATAAGGLFKKLNSKVSGKLGLLKFADPIIGVFEGLKKVNSLLDRTKKKADDAATALSALTGPVGQPGGSGLPPGLTGPKGKAPPKSVITQIPNRLIDQELNARLAGNKAALRAVLEQEAEALKAALKDPRLKPGQRVAIKQSLLGINDEIKGMDDEIIQAAKDKKQAAADARKKAAAAAAAAKQKLAQANKDLIAKFKDQADAIKSAVLDAFDTKTDKIQNARALADAKAALRAARQIGGPQGIKLATRDVTDAQRAIRRQQLEDTTFRVGRGPAGPVNRVQVGTQNFYITTSDPEKAAREVLKLLGRKSSAGAPQSRGRVPGRQAY